MMALPQYMYRDPLEVLEQAERRSCKGCIHKKRAWGADVCEHPNKSGGKAERRCKQYSTGEEQ